MSFTSLLPTPKHSAGLYSKGGLQQIKSKELVVQALVHQNHDVDDSVFDPGIATNLKFQDFIPIRQRNFDLQIPLPSQDEINETYRRTKKMVDGILAKNRHPEVATVGSRISSEGMEEISVRSSGYSHSKKKLKVIEHTKDPLQPDVRRAAKVIAPVDEPMTPIFHKTDSGETAKNLNKETRNEWKIPPAISSWKNPNGYTIGIDKRVLMDGRYSKDRMQSHEVNDRFATLSVALEKAELEARQVLKLKAEAKKRIAEEQNKEKENRLRLLAQRSREERSRHRSKKRDSSAIEGGYENEQEREVVDYEDAKKSRREEITKEIRRSKMSTVDHLRELICSQGREVSEKVMLGVAKSNNSSRVHYDSRLYTKGANTLVNRNEESVYDTPLFSKLGSSYRSSFNRLNEDVQGYSGLSAGQIEPIKFTTSEKSEAHKDSVFQKKSENGSL